MGETPRDAWERLTKIHGLKTPLSAHRRRHIFGLPAERRIGSRGIRFLGLHYQSLELQKLHRKIGQKSVQIRVCRMDLSAISVWVDNGWITVPHSLAEIDLSGVSYWEWVAAAQDLRRRNADVSKLSADIVNAAIRDQRDTAEHAIKRAELGSPILTEEDVEGLDRDLFRSFQIVERGGGSGRDILGDEGTGGAVGKSDEGAPAREPLANPQTPASLTGGRVGQQPTEPEEWLIED